MTAGEEEEGEQSPGYTTIRWPECKCPAPAHGGCHCDDDGTVCRPVEHERLEHDPSGFPRRT